MELLQLRYFQHLAKNEHLTNTAKEMFVTASAISSSVSKLESELGVCLFDRVGRTLKLNENGKIYLVFIEELFGILEKANSEMNNIKVHNKESIIIGVRVPYLWENIFNNFHKLYPNIFFSQLTIDMELHKHEMYKYPVDHFIAVSGSIIDPAWNFKTFFNDSIMLLVPSTHRLANVKEVDLEEIKNEDFIGYKGTVSYQRCYNELFTHAGFTPKSAVFCDLSLVNTYVASLNKIAFCTKFSYMATRPSNVVAVKIKDKTSELPLAIYWKKTLEQSVTSRIFREFLSNYNYGNLYSKSKIRKHLVK